jgi:hypothetical protein
MYDENYGFKHQGRPIKAVATEEGHQWKTKPEWVIFYIMKWKDPVLEVKKLLGNPALNTFATTTVLGDFYNWIGEEKLEKPWKYVDLYLNKDFKHHVVTEYIKQAKEKYNG